MRLDELEWWHVDVNEQGTHALAKFPFNTDFQFWRNRDGTYNIWCTGGELRYQKLDPLTAQAVLYELCLNPLNQNGTIEPYLDPNNSPITSDT